MTSNDDQQTTPIEPAGRETAADVQPARRSRRPLWIGLGAGAAALGLVAGTIGVTALVLDDDDDDRDDSSLVADGGPAGDGGGAAGDAGARGDRTADVEDFVAARDAAIAAADGVDVASIEVERSGWSVDVLLADGSEVDVDLDEAFAAVRVGAPDADDDRETRSPLATGELEDALRAAIDDQGGEAHAISADDGAGGYDVDLVVDGRDVDVDLDASFAVIGVDQD